MQLINILLMAGNAGAQGGQSSPYSSLIMMALIVGVFYFFFIRPQQKKTKEVKKFREGLKKGDKVITIGGIHGKVLEVTETTVVIEVEGQNRLKLNKDAVTADGNSDQNLQAK